VSFGVGCICPSLAFKIVLGHALFGLISTDLGRICSKRARRAGHYGLKQYGIGL